MPAVFLSCPQIIFIVVDFPAPLTPKKRKQLALFDLKAEIMYSLYVTETLAKSFNLYYIFQSLHLFYRLKSGKRF